MPDIKINNIPNRNSDTTMIAGVFTAYHLHLWLCQVVILQLEVLVVEEDSLLCTHLHLNYKFNGICIIASTGSAQDFGDLTVYRMQT